MSNFRDWKEFPGRCGDLLKMFSKEAERNDREVTLLLAVATACICIRRDHLTDKNNVRYDAELKKSFGDFANGKIPSELQQAKYGKIAKGEVTGLPDNWDGFSAFAKLPADTNNATILSILRNALGHGNLYTEGKSQIDRIVFLSQEKDRNGNWTEHYRCLVLMPSQLRKFVESWIGWCVELHESSAFALAKLLDDQLTEQELAA